MVEDYRQTDVASLTLRSHTHWAHTSHPCICHHGPGWIEERVVGSVGVISPPQILLFSHHFPEAALGIMVNPTLHF